MKNSREQAPSFLKFLVQLVVVLRCLRVRIQVSRGCTFGLIAPRSRVVREQDVEPVFHPVRLI